MQTTSSSLIGDRRANEDCHAIHRMPDGTLLMVLADGHGGRQVAENSVRLVVERAATACPGVLASRGRCEERTMAQEFTRLFEAADTFAAVPHVGCTLVVALVFEHVACIASCGDSQALVCSAAKGKVVVTAMHRPTDAAEVRRVQNAGAFYGGGVYVTYGSAGLAMTRAIGDHHLPFAIATPDVYRVELPSDCVLALFSDGLSDAFTEPEIVHLVTRPVETAGGMYGMARTIVTTATQRRKGVADNTTLLLGRVI